MYNFQLILTNRTNQERNLLFTDYNSLVVYLASLNFCYFKKIEIIERSFELV